MTVTDPAPLYPLFADLRGRRVVVVGGGAVAARKIEPLLAAGARVLVVAPAPGPAVAAWVAAGALEHRADAFADDALDGAWLAIAATDDPDTNAAVVRAAEARRVFANVVDDGAASSWHAPARVERGPLQIAIGSGGGAPMLARHLRERLEADFDESLADLARLLTRERLRLRRHVPRPADRRRFLDALLAGPLPAALRAGDMTGAQALFDAALADAPARPRRGRVALVGAGPGDAGLLTLRALRVLNQADVVLYDRLVSADVLARVRRDATLVPVGKAAGEPGIGQEAIHALMREHAVAGRDVVRLKGGDPFVFGRGGEELQYLRAHGIDYEVVPGITAAVACAAYAGVPLTHRGLADGLRFVTAHGHDDTATPDWPALAQPRQTLAVYMGVAAMRGFRDALVAHGRAASTPFALVENGSRPQQRVVAGTLAELPELAARYDVRSPALLIVGEVAALATSLHWFGAPPATPAGAAVAARTERVTRPRRPPAAPAPSWPHRPASASAR